MLRERWVLPRLEVRGSKRRDCDEYTVLEKTQIARIATSPHARVRCPRCGGELEVAGGPESGCWTADTVWDFRCAACRRSVLLVHLPGPEAHAG